MNANPRGPVLTLKRIAAEVLCHPLVGHGIALAFGNRIPSRGLRILTDNPSIRPEIKSMLLFGLYESAEARFILAHLRRDLDVVELGSSMGYVACLIRRLLPVERRLVCVEADAELIPVIEANLAGNTEGPTEVRHQAIYYGAATVTLTKGGTNIEGSISTDGTGEVVPATSLSALLADTDIERFTLVSDIEGAEAGFILDDAEALNRCQQLIIELHRTQHGGRTVEVDELVERLVVEHGFQLTDRYGPVCVFDRAQAAQP